MLLLMFETFTELHYSQTEEDFFAKKGKFEIFTELHYSQT